MINGEPPVSTQHPAVQLMIFAVITVVSFTFCAVIGTLLMIPLYDVNVFAQPDILEHPDNPEVIGALKLLQLMNSVGLFLLPPIIFSFFVTRNKLHYFQLDGKATPLTYFIVPLLFITALPLINWLAEINSQLDLPAYMSEIERWMKAMEERAAEMTEAFLQMETFSAFIYNFFLIAIIPAVAEELFFRGTLQKLLIKWVKNPHVGIWITAILFSALHGQFFGFLPRLALGALLGYLLVWSGSLWLPILGHFINNGLAVTLAYLIQTGVIPEDIEKIGAENEAVYFPFTSLIIVAGLLYLVYQKEKENKEMI